MGSSSSTEPSASSARALCGRSAKARATTRPTPTPTRTPSSALRLAYLGTSGYAADVLRALAASEYRPALVVTPPDRRQGRGRRTSPPPVAELAVELGLPLHQTESVNSGESAAAFAEAGI